MRVQVVWHGTEQEGSALLSAIKNNCTCQFGAMGMRTTTCTVHTMMVEDQRALDGLLFMRRDVARLHHGEWNVTVP